MVLILFYMGVVPVRLAFSDYAPDNEFVQGSEGWYWVDFVADTVFLVDIVMNFFVIIKHGNGEYLINFVDIAIFQIHSKWFYVDMVASIPTSYMNYETRDDWDKDDEMLNASADDGAEGGVTQQLSGVNKLLRLVRIIKLARVFRMVRFMKDFEDLAIVNPSSLRLVRLLVFFVIILHFVACGFWMLLSGDHFCQDEDTDHGECSADIAWYIQKGTAENSSLTVQYMMAFYWAVSAMTGVGYDIEPRTYWQHVYTTVIIVCGMFMNAILIGSVPGAIENLDRVQSDRKRELDAINDYLRKQHVPAYLQRSVRSYYEYLHGCDHDMRLGEEERLQSLPESLKTRVKVATAIRAIERIPLFSDLHASCKIQIIHRLNPVIKVPGERLAIQDDVGEAMYIIKNGRVQLKRIPKPKRSANKWLSATEKLRKPVLLGHPVAEKQPETTGSMGDVANTVVREIVKVAELGAGDFFGENCLLGRKNDTTAIAADYSDLLQLTVDDCKELCEEYAELKEQITSTAKSRYLAHVPHEERHDDDIRNLEESIRLERMQEGDVGVPLNGSAPSRLSTRRMTRLLMDEFADLSAQHGILRGMGESKHNGQ
jgi:CRP-like cAMP-binding protein